MIAMGALDVARIPPAYGLANTGAICYMNALLQALATATHFTQVVVASRAYMAQTRTGAALYNYARAVEAAAAREPGFAVDERHSAEILRALVEDLRERRPGVRFGGGMEGAAEAVSLILDMVEPPSAVAPADAGEATCHAGQDANPVAQAFRMRVSVQTWCECCFVSGRRGPGVARAHRAGVVAHHRDTQYIFNMFPGAASGATPAEFARRLQTHTSVVEDYKCEVCAAAGEPTGRVFRTHSMTRIPPVLQVLFPQYHGHQMVYYPERFQVAGIDGRPITYALVAQVEHAGCMDSGHYWARALRQGRDGAVVCAELNDRAVGAAARGLGPTAAAYIVFYHVVRGD